LRFHRDYNTGAKPNDGRKNFHDADSPVKKYAIKFGQTCVTHQIIKSDHEITTEEHSEQNHSKPKAFVSTDL